MSEYNVKAYVAAHKAGVPDELAQVVGPLTLENAETLAMALALQVTSDGDQRYSKIEIVWSKSDK